MRIYPSIQTATHFCLPSATTSSYRIIIIIIIYHYNPQLFEIFYLQMNIYI